MALATLDAVVLDCPDPVALAGFYAGVLGGTVEKHQGQDQAPEGEGAWVDLRVPGGQTLAFQRAPGFVPPRWPAPDASQQCHLDLVVEDLDTAEKGVLALGARPLDTEDRERSFRVYADPAGHPFCLCTG
ncbi:VOC family protein [Streptomyces pluripotens]|uniref:VOC family protein n=1 Tax=Streptomyces pluripotens TaxID=1355015 RepID=A0A221NXX4_9ACTN|nr:MULTISPECIES: VOC family protein [Streptomyces]ARP70557.1 glyoxalase/bleomycin resistance/dioxygenase family protein [Streptomyces pluripotens]ASN24817.1 VOC family protein [Streptomyces pluripotens]KIE23879.1 glyoxalase [Streptomyces sp. MUSC 125]MCH0556758.1 VOC family protein [Streptomyces sp. MUM 16J]